MKSAAAATSSTSAATAVPLASTTSRRRTFIFGDIHGCKEELDQLLVQEGFRMVTPTEHQHQQDNQTSIGELEGDRLVHVGDLVNKGYDSIGVVRRCMELGAVGVRGNHEDALLQMVDIVRRREAEENSVKATTVTALSSPSLSQPKVDSSRDDRLMNALLDDGAAGTEGLAEDQKWKETASRRLMSLLAKEFLEQPDAEQLLGYLKNLPHTLYLPEHHVLIVHASFNPQRVTVEALLSEINLLLLSATGEAKGDEQSVRCHLAPEIIGRALEKVILREHCAHDLTTLPKVRVSKEIVCPMVERSRRGREYGADEGQHQEEEEASFVEVEGRNEKGCLWAQYWSSYSTKLSRQLEEHLVEITTQPSSISLPLIVFGHDGKSGLQDRRPHSLGLDTSCFFGDRLTAAIFHEEEAVMKKKEGNDSLLLPPSSLLACRCKLASIDSGANQKLLKKILVKNLLPAAVAGGRKIDTEVLQSAVFFGENEGLGVCSVSRSAAGGAAGEEEVVGFISSHCPKVAQSILVRKEEILRRMSSKEEEEEHNTPKNSSWSRVVEFQLMNRPAPKSKTQLKITGLHPTIDNKGLLQAFGRFGKITSGFVVRGKNFAFVEFSQPVDAAAARRYFLDQSSGGCAQLGGTQLKVDFAPIKR